MFHTQAEVLQCPYLGLLRPTEAGMGCVKGAAAVREELASGDAANANAHDVVSFE